MEIPCAHMTWQGAMFCAEHKASATSLRQKVYKRRAWWVVQESPDQGIRGLKRLSR